MPSRPDDSEPTSDRYEPPEVEEIDTVGPISTAPDGTTVYPSVTLIDEDEDPTGDEQARERDG